MTRPIILITRPDPAGLGFAKAITEKTDRVDIVLTPAFSLTALNPILPDFDVAVFTSAAAVAWAPIGSQRLAYCVGTKTAQAARNNGYNPIDAQGTVQDLIDLILANRPSARLLYLRAEKIRTDLRARLCDAGLNCAERILYRKTPLTPAQPILDQIHQAQHVIAPVFSPETMELVGKWPLPWDRVNIIAMSAPIAQSAEHLPVAAIHIASEPTEAAMTDLTTRLIA